MDGCVLGTLAVVLLMFKIVTAPLPTSTLQSLDHKTRLFAPAN